MRLARKLMLVGLAAVAAMALSASSALAVTVANEPGDTCTDVSPASGTNVHAAQVSGGCPIRAISEAPMEFGAFGSMMFCDNSFEARIGGNGHGYIYSMSLTGCSPQAFFPCEEGTPEEPEAWEVNLTSETTMEMRMCFTFNPDMETGKIRCHLANIQINESPDHQYEFMNGAYPNHSACEEAGLSWAYHWNQVIDEDHPAIEIVD